MKNLVFLFSFLFLSPVFSQSFDALKKTLSSNKNSMTKSWHLVKLMGKRFPSQSKNLLVKLSKDKKWYLRSASLLALKDIDLKLAQKTAKKLLKDPALVVRSQAVRIIKEQGFHSLRKDLWEAFYASHNFKNKKSLWIRKDILKTLSQFQKSSDFSSFLKVLRDEKDKELRNLAVSALSNMKKLNFPPSMSLDQRRLSLIHQFDSSSF